MDQLWGLDVERIQQYLFSVPRLREVRRASHLLDYVIRVVAPKDISSCGGTPVSAAAGNVKALIPAGKSEELSRTILQAFGQALPGLQVVCAGTKVDGSGLAEVLEALARSLDDAKGAKPPVAAFPHAGIMEYCALCRQAPAVKRRKAPGGKETESLCSDCLARAEFDPDRHSTPIRRLEERLESKGREIDAASAWKAPDSIAELITGVKCEDERRADAEIERLHPRRRYIGLVVADGNRLGRKWHAAEYRDGDLRSQAKQASKCSEAIDEVVRASIIEAMEECWSQQQRAASKGAALLPIMPLLVGGDDIVVLCRASIAVPFAAALCRLFGEKTAACGDIALVGGRLSLSAGVAIAHHKFPMLRLHALAKDLMQEAKGLSDACAGNSDGAEVGSLSFLRITSAMSGGLRAERDALVVKHPGAAAIRTRLTCCPYTALGSGQNAPDRVPDIRMLLTAADQIRKGGLPRGRLHRAAEWPRLAPDERARVIAEETARLDRGPKACLDSLSLTLGCAANSASRPARAPKFQAPGNTVVRYEWESPYQDLLDLEACDV